MARFSDEAWDYMQDCKEKKALGNQAKHRRGHTGKGGGMKTAADYMTKKQLRAMDSEVKTYRMGSPMNWEEFSAMPDDLKKMYIKNLRKKFNIPDDNLANAMGVDISEFGECLKTIKLSSYNLTQSIDEWGRFADWWGISERSE